MTPMLQVVREVVNNPDDKTQACCCPFLYACACRKSVHKQQTTRLSRPSALPC